MKRKTKNKFNFNLKCFFISIISDISKWKKRKQQKVLLSKIIYINDMLIQNKILPFQLLITACISNREKCLSQRNLTNYSKSVEFPSSISLSIHFLQNFRSVPYFSHQFISFLHITHKSSILLSFKLLISIHYTPHFIISSFLAFFRFFLFLILGYFKIIAISLHSHPIIRIPDSGK